MAENELHPAEIKKLEAEAAKALAEARKAEAEAENELQTLIEAKHLTRLQEIRMLEAEEKELARMADDDHHRTYRFLGPVGGSSVKAAVERLVQWHRLDPECEITFVIDSPGGGIIEGFHLYDTIQWLKEEGHKVTTIAQGMAASMGGILLQAGTERVMSAQASMLIHEASFGAIGSFGEVEDQVEFVKKLQERLLGILSERSHLSKTQIKNRWKRKNWWLDADEALQFGFIDRIS